METYDRACNDWPIVPTNVDDAPHAPWWSPNTELNKSVSNPRAEIAGYLLDYPNHSPPAIRSTVVTAVIDHLRQHADKQMEMHDLFCYLRFHESRSLTADQRSVVEPILARVINRSVERDPAAWSGYGLPPLKVISTPDSPFMPGFELLVEQNLDMLIESQAADGAWYPNWSWADSWPDAWAQAQVEWAGSLTVQNLRTLRAFGRFDI